MMIHYVSIDRPSVTFLFMKLQKFQNSFNRRPILNAILLYGFYTLCFFVTEQLNTREAFLVHSVLDDLIPFSKYAVIPYCLWFPEIAIVLLYIYFRGDQKEFFRAVFLPVLLMFCSLLLYYLFPTEIHLRPDTVPGNDLFAWLTRFIYSVDNSKNVCPSIHVAVSYLMGDLWQRNTDHKTGIIMIVLNIIISISTLFLKQHSFIDVVAGLLYGRLIRFIYDRLFSD